jgi:CRP-like cAMP-binding protein
MIENTPASGNRLLAALSQPDFDLLKPWLSRANLETGAVVNNADDRVETVYFPEGVILSVVTLMSDGRGVESYSIGRESGFGMLNALSGSVAFNRVVAQVPGPSIAIPSARFRAAAESSASLRELIVRHITAQAAMTEQSAACNALHHVDARLCRWLLLTQDRANSAVLPLTQDFLAFMLGVRRTTVTAAAQNLSAAGLIRYSRGRLEILDREGLLAASCECYATVNQRTDDLIGIEG